MQSNKIGIGSDFALLLLGLIFLCSCKKDAPPDIHYSYLQESLHPYMFKIGSYWVYENDSTGLLDSVIVTDTKKGFFTTPPLGPGTPSNEKIEYYKISLFSFLNAQNYTDFLSADLITRNGNESPEFGQPILLSGRAIGSHVSGAYVFDVIDSLDVNAESFFNVIQMKIVSDEQQEFIFENNTHLYYQDHIGLIKREIGLGDGQFESWSLIRWNINL
jgi:hypothetical protein